MWGLLSTIIRGRERADQESAYDGKNTQAIYHGCAPITSTSEAAHEVARTSTRRLSHLARAVFFLDFFSQPPTSHTGHLHVLGFESGSKLTLLALSSVCLFVCLLE